jgi:hypothetical protein
MPHRLFFALLAVLALGACASTAVRYTDPTGKEYAGTIDPVRNSLTAQIGSKVYRGPFRANEWGQAKSTLTSAGSDPLYCDFVFRAVKVQGSCTDLAGGDYRMQSR